MSRSEKNLLFREIGYLVNLTFGLLKSILEVTAYVWES